MCSKVEDKTTKTGCRSKACFVYLYVCGFFWFLKKNINQIGFSGYTN